MAGHAGQQGCDLLARGEGACGIFWIGQNSIRFAGVMVRSMPGMSAPKRCAGTVTSRAAEERRDNGDNGEAVLETTIVVRDGKACPRKLDDPLELLPRITFDASTPSRWASARLR